MRRDLLPTVVPSVVAAGALVAVAGFALVAGAPVGHAADRPSSAYGVAAVGQVPLPKTPYIESVDGRERSSSALEIPRNALLSARAATVTAGADSAAVEILDVTIGRGVFDRVKVPPDLKAACANLPAQGAEDLPVPDIELPDIGLPLPESPGTEDLPVKNLPELCDLLLTPPSSVLDIDALNVWCDGDRGGVDVGSLTLLGQRIDVPSTQRGATIPAAPLATVTVNEQTKRPDGSFTVTGLVINLGNGAEIIGLGSVTCAKPAPRVPKPSPTRTTPEEAKTPPIAPVPAPIKTRHPVTG